MTDYLPPVIDVSASVDLWTYADVVRHLLDTQMDSNRGRASRLAKRAALDAYRDFPHVAEWQYFKRTGSFTTEPAFTSGSISYDHTGGSSERLMTITGDVWPDNIAEYAILVGGYIYEVEQRLSSTTITLDSRTNPSADIAATESFYAYRQKYPVPYDFRSGSDIISVNENLWPTYVSPEDAIQFSTFMQAPQDITSYYTIAPDGLGVLSFQLFPPPLTERRYDFVYQSRPRPLVSFGNSTEYVEGTVDVAGDTVTKNSGEIAWPTTIVGCVMRLAAASTSGPPTGSVGDDENDNPYLTYRIVKERSSATELVLDSAPGNMTNAFYSIGSAIDLEPSVMLNCYLGMCELKHSQYLRQDGQQQSLVYDMYIKRLRLAMQADNRGHMRSSSYSIIDWVMNAPLKYLEQ